MRQNIYSVTGVTESSPCFANGDLANRLCAPISARVFGGFTSLNQRSLRVLGVTAHNRHLAHRTLLMARLGFRRKLRLTKSRATGRRSNG